MSASHLVIVESPAKAKTINKYLGRDYTVLASFGHIRDLPPKDGSVRPDEDFAMDWELQDRAKKRVQEIKQAAKDVDTIFLATDPDREGEAISWHIEQVLRADRKLSKKNYQRVTFNEVTKAAVTDAISTPRSVNDDLVEAYMARRALDYLVGFTLSPVLWRKLPGAKSAGRVQSVSLRLICEREAEIEAFKPEEYWTVEAEFVTLEGAKFTARLTHLDGRKLGKFDLNSEEKARAAVESFAGDDFHVTAVERKEVKRHPSPPFTTSTLQQEASRKLGFGASHTMRVAQKLYEGVDLGGETVGLITYMRTDGTQLSAEAINGARTTIRNLYGDQYLPTSPRAYKSKAKNAQEAHEAVRPTDLSRSPDRVARALNKDELRLYELIWKRTMACQMESAILDQMSVDVVAGDVNAERRKAVFRATGSAIKFDGFIRVYQEGRDDPGDGDDEDGNRLPPLKQGAPLDLPKPARADQHFTQPPPRYTEASLVKRMEELGIGRPSTYASILQVLQDRDYVSLEKKRFRPSDRGRLVTAFLANYFERYVQYDFTANLEEQLDDISGGRLDWKEVLRRFWQDFNGTIEDIADLRISHVIDALNEAMAASLFPSKEDGSNPRACPSCETGEIGIRLSRGGAFLGCSNYPECRYTRPLEGSQGGGEAEAEFPRALGADPETGLDVSIRKGPYGFYAQLGEGAEGEKPVRTSLTKTDDPFTIELPRAAALLHLPRTVGSHPDTQKVISAGIGRYGPYLRHDGAYKSIPADEDVLTIGMNRAVELLATARKSGGSEALRTLGEHPDGGPMTIHSGRYGPYVKHGRTMASLPKSATVESITEEEAVALIAAKVAKGGKTAAKGKSTAKSKAATKPAAKAASAKSKSTAKTTKAKAAGAKRTTKSKTAKPSDDES